MRFSDEFIHKLIHGLFVLNVLIHCNLYMKMHLFKIKLVHIYTEYSEYFDGKIANWVEMLRNFYFQDDPINWDEPLLFQVPKLGDRYFEWVHRPVDGHLRLMKSEVCEFFSQCPWYMVPIVWIPVVLLMLFTSYTNLREDPCSFAVTFSEGSVSQLGRIYFFINMGCWGILNIYTVHYFSFSVMSVQGKKP